MSVPLLDVQTGEFDERNLLLQLTLGLVAESAQLDRLLDRFAPAIDVPDPAPAGDDPILHCILGLLAVRADLWRHLEAAARERGAATSAPHSRGGTALPRVLR